MGDSYGANMGDERRVDPVTGRTFTTSGNIGTYSNSQIIPYSNSQIIPYSQPYATSSHTNAKPPKIKTSRSWSLNDAEMKRKRRVTSYKVYTVEGKVKSSFSRSVRWLKTKYFDLRYGWW